ncbi:MAG TPA: DUF2470 domain-containing protein [Pseudonocardiaceae bacterium]|nr:DUF2470 domain-containing protein [Pseudonocardiaceae bacterium]
MSQTVRRPPVPQPAERARTIASRGGRAVLLRSEKGSEKGKGAGLAGSKADRIEPHLHHLHEDGSVTVLLADDHPFVAAVADTPTGRLPAMVEIADRAAVALREPVRALLWVTGLLVVLIGPAAREQALRVAEARPDSRLLDVGHGMTVLRLTPASLVLADSEGTCSLAPAEFAAATPDPFCEYEDHWLRHLESAHRDVVGMLTRLLPETLRGGHVRPLGLDRFGLRLRVEAAGADHDVRLAFSQPVETPTQLAVELRRMVGCPFLAQARKSG